MPVLVLYHVQLGSPGDATGCILALQRHGKDAVRATGGLVHGRRGCDAVQVADKQQLQCLFLGGDKGNVVESSVLLLVQFVLTSEATS